MTAAAKEILDCLVAEHLSMNKQVLSRLVTWFGGQPFEQRSRILRGDLSDEERARLATLQSAARAQEESTEGRGRSAAKRRGAAG